MKLAAIGLVTVGIGIALGVPGLMGIGLWWVVMGLLVRLHGRRIKELEAASATTGTGATDARGRTAVVDGRTFAIGTLLLLLLGVPSLAVGVLTIGIDADDEPWRWLPITVGGLAVAFGGVSALLYLLGSAASAVGGSADKPTIPATLWIRSARETGTFVNERPRLELELLVEPDAGTGVASYEVTKKATVPFTALGAVRVGDGFQALVAGPEDPTSMEIDWDRPVASGARADVSSRLEELERLRRDTRISDEEYQAQRQRILGSL